MSLGRWLGWVRFGIGALLAAVTLPALQGCFDTTDRKPAEFGGETHFMSKCEDGCEAGLSCVCGVCTQACSESASCGALAEHAICAPVDSANDACGADAPARACAALCGGDQDCAELGDRFACVQGQCRPRTSGGTQDGSDSAPVFEGALAACSQGECGLAMRPLVMLLVDTSGSMEYKADCACATPGCTECLPDCSRRERNRFADVIEALGGSFEDFSCEALPRDEDHGATYDVGYFLPYHRPAGHQRDDGLIDAYGERLRFALATFDGWDTYKGAPPLVTPEEFDADRAKGWRGLWSYNPERSLGPASLLGTTGRPSGQFRYPGSAKDFYIDTGIRSTLAADGALLISTEPTRADVVRALHERLKATLRATRPYGGTPIAAALDDLYYLMGMDLLTAAERALPAPKHVVLITDGRPDADYRDLGCNCANEGDPDDPRRCMTAQIDEVPEQYRPENMYCPYPTPEEAARALHCGRGASCDGPVDRVSVVGYSNSDQEAIDRLDGIAAAGGSSSARFASNPAALRAQLEALLEQIAVEAE